MSLRLKRVDGRHGFAETSAGPFRLSVGYSLSQDGQGLRWSVSGDAGRFDVRVPTLDEAKQAAEDALRGQLVKGLAAFGERP